MWKTASVLITIVLMLVLLGIVILTSTSEVLGQNLHNDPYFYLKRQVLALILGVVGAVVVARIPYPWWKKLAPVVGIVSLVLLAAAATPGIGIEVKGSRRWLPLGPLPLTFQPSELAKFSLIALLAMWMSTKQRRNHLLGHGVVIPLGITGAFAVGILAGPDYGTTMLVGVIALSVLYLGGARFSHLLVAGIAAFSAIAVLIARNPNRMRRFIAFLNPEEYAANEAYQLNHSLYAFIIGGAKGVGLGDSLQKRLYLPEAHTDFIFAILGEELGLAASLGVLLLFGGFFACGVLIAYRANDTFGRLLAFGISATISLQAALNVAVVTGVLPTKGIALPFISYGGTNLAVTLVMVGVLVNIALETQHSGDGSPVMAVRDRVRRV
ncbi:MAG TPA: putative lipid II flippase FtsW [Kiritimatiellia bacterium]|nr:putative lipid II flippase FtsW [Kiritimatiellia bacterium]